jgi:hypothetical protein
MWTEVSSSVPHFLQMGSLHNSIICKCLHKVLCPVTSLDCVLLKDNSRAPVARSGPEINSRACLCVLQGPCHNARCFFSIQRFIFLLTFCLETPMTGSGPTNCWAEPSLASLSAISFPLAPATESKVFSDVTLYLRACNVPLKVKVLHYLKTSGTTHPLTQYQALDDLYMANCCIHYCH